jgi:uncharacterized protein involved in response to NO
MNRRLHLPALGEPVSTATRAPHPLLAKGFRPFFLLSAIFAASILPVWMLSLLGVLHPGVQLDPVAWHGHEMVFGFASAVIAGFLLTAVGNWTGRETLTGRPLAGLALLWIAGRVALVSPIPLPVAAAVDLAFLPALAFAIGRPLVLTRNWRNLIMVAVVLGLWVADGMIYSPAWRGHGLTLGVDLVVLLIVVLAGRIFPMFTRNAVGNAAIRSSPALDAVAIVSTIAVVVLDQAAPASRIAGIGAGLASVLLVVRSVHWGARYSWRFPLLWILHVSYAFIPIGFALRAASSFGAPVTASAATHALTVGAIGCATIGMMARVALGHTGRLLTVGRPMAVAFGLLVLAAAVRIAGALVTPAYVGSLFVAGTLWTAAFVVYAWIYAPIVMAPRVDGKAG